MPCLSHGIFSISLSAGRKLVKMLSTENVTDINGTSKTTGAGLGSMHLFI